MKVQYRDGTSVLIALSQGGCPVDVQHAHVHLKGYGERLCLSAADLKRELKGAGINSGPAIKAWNKAYAW